MFLLHMVFAVHLLRQGQAFPFSLLLHLSIAVQLLEQLTGAVVLGAKGVHIGLVHLVVAHDSGVEAVVEIPSH